jgi:hypothetical protein
MGAGAGTRLFDARLEQHLPHAPTPPTPPPPRPPQTQRGMADSSQQPPFAPRLTPEPGGKFGPLHTRCHGTDSAGSATIRRHQQSGIRHHQAAPAERDPPPSGGTSTRFLDANGFVGYT